MKKMNFFQKILGNERIQAGILSGNKASYHLYFNKPVFNWYKLKDLLAYGETVDIAFHTDRYQDLEVAYVIPTGLDGKEVTLEMLNTMIQHLSKEKYMGWNATDISPFLIKDQLLGMYSRGKGEVAGSMKVVQDLVIFCTRKTKNDTLIQLSSMIPVEAPDELIEEVRKIFQSVKFSSSV